MYEYTICNVFDEKIFEEQCQALEKNIPNLTKTYSKMLVDVDGTQIMCYHFPNGTRLAVYNTKDFGVEIRSEVELEQYFQK